MTYCMYRGSAELGHFVSAVLLCVLTPVQSMPRLSVWVAVDVFHRDGPVHVMCRAP